MVQGVYRAEGLRTPRDGCAAYPGWVLRTPRMGASGMGAPGSAGHNNLESPRHGGKPMATLPDLVYDPADMQALKSKLAKLPEADRFKSFELDRIEIGPDALLRLPELLGELAPPGPVLIVQDATRMRRGGHDLKELVARLLTDAGWEVETITLHAGEDGQAHADEATVASVSERL